MLCCVNEYIVQIISATRLWLISRYSHHTLKKRWKTTAKNGHPCRSDFHHFAYKQIASTWRNNHWFVRGKHHFIRITSTLMIVVFSINWSQMFFLYYIRYVANSNWKLWTTEKWQHRFGITGNVDCVPIHAFALHSDTCFFQWSFAWNLKNIFPIVWYCCNIRCPYKISNILYKTNKKAVFFINNIWHITWPFLSAFIFLAAWRVFVQKHWKVCCRLLQWSDVGTVVWCRTCTVRFFRSLLRLFSSFPPIWVCEMKVLWKVASSCAEDLKPVFLYLAEYSIKNFITIRQYLVNLTCNCWFRMCTQFHQKLVSYKCMLFVDCLVVLQEYFVN